MAVHHKHVVGVFETRAEAERVIEELHRMGFAEGDIGYAIRDAGAATEAGAAPGEEVHLPAPEAAAGSAATGALTGGLLGGLIGAAAALVVPGVGPVLAGGILASALGGAAIGAAAGGLLGGLVAIGVPEEEAAHYEREFQAGRAVVTVRADGRAEEARAVMRRHGAMERPRAPAAA